MKWLMNFKLFVVQLRHLTRLTLSHNKIVGKWTSRDVTIS